MTLTTLDYIPGKQIIEHYGLVNGSTVRSKHFGRDFFAGLKNIIGGELKGYTELMEETRDEAIERLTQMAQAKGANAILNIRFGTSDVAGFFAVLNQADFTFEFAKNFISNGVSVFNITLAIAIRTGLAQSFN